MATRAQQFRANDQRKQSAKTNPTRTAPKKRTPSPEASQRTVHARKKATHALEITATGKRPSRESTRGSANRMKADAAFNLTESMVKGSPEARFRKASAKGLRVRGSTRRP